MLNTRRVIAILQIVGAGCFVWLCLRAGSASVHVGLLLAFAVVSIVSGVGLWRGNPAAIRTALLVQAMQIPVITSSRFDYALISGLGMIVGVGPTDHFNRLAKLAEFDYKWISGFPNPGDGTPLRLGVNLIALAAFIWLLRQKLIRRETA